MAKAKKAAVESLWESNLDVIDNPAAPSAFKRLRTVRNVKVLLWASIVTCGFYGVTFVATTFNSNIANTGDATTSANASNLNSLGKAAAISAVELWVASIPAPLPGAKIVSWDGYETLPQPVADGEKDDGFATEVHAFTLTTGEDDNVRIFNTTIEVRVHEILGSKVTSTPTLLPRTPTSVSAFTSQTTWAGHAESSASQPTKAAIDQWVAAYISGKPETLRLSVGDTDADHAYLPLAGISSATVSVVGASDVLLDDPDATPTQQLVRVTLAISWIGQPAPDSDAKLPQVTYDLLVDGSNTAAPRVVSWGGPGTGPKLTPYSTAVVGLDLKAAVVPVGGSVDVPTDVPAVVETNEGSE